MTYYVYIMASSSRVLYTGVTNNIERRVSEHNDGLVPGFSARYKTRQLVYFEPFGDIRAAISREKQIKGWLRVKKLALIQSVNPRWKDLSRASRGAPSRAESLVSHSDRGNPKGLSASCHSERRHPEGPSASCHSDRHLDGPSASCHSDRRHPDGPSASCHSDRHLDGPSASCHSDRHLDGPSASCHSERSEESLIKSEKLGVQSVREILRPKRRDSE